VVSSNGAEDCGDVNYLQDAASLHETHITITPPITKVQLLVTTGTPIAVVTLTLTKKRRTSGKYPPTVSGHGCHCIQCSLEKHTNLPDVATQTPEPTRDALADAKTPKRIPGTSTVWKKLILLRFSTQFLPCAVPHAFGFIEQWFRTDASPPRI